MSWLNGKKTYIVAIVTICYALVSMWNGSMTPDVGIGLILGACGFGALRHGVSTSAK